MTIDDFPQLRRLAKLFAIMVGGGFVFLVVGILLTFHATAAELPVICAVLVVGLVAIGVGLRSLRKVRRTIATLRLRR